MREMFKLIVAMNFMTYAIGFIILTEVTESGFLNTAGFFGAIAMIILAAAVTFWKSKQKEIEATK